MKRGLKGLGEIGLVDRSTRYNRFPDEKGTESSGKTYVKNHQISYNRFPDEKGTERECRHPHRPRLSVLQPFPR